MTFSGMANLFFQRIDQSGSPAFNDTETDRLLNWGYDVWYIINRKKFDTDQANTVNMTHLIRPLSFTNKSEITVVGVGTDIPNYRDIAKLRARFNAVDCNGVAYVDEINVTPIPISVVDVNRNDPYNQPTDKYPMYYQSHNGTNRTVSILSATTPVALIGDYFKELQAIDYANSPNTEFEAQDYVARQVVDLAKILAKGDLDDYPAVKNAVSETAMSMS